MTETPKNYQNPGERYDASVKQDWDPSANNPFIGRSISEEAQAAQRFIENTDTTPTPTDTTETPRNKWSPAAKTAATIGAGAALVTGGLIIADNVAPRQEIASVTTTVDQGGDITSAVDTALTELEAQNIDPADPTERQDVISQAVNLNSDAQGIVQPGETVTVVATKTPIFGDTRYEAVPDPQPQDETDTQLPTLPSPEQK